MQEGEARFAFVIFNITELCQLYKVMIFIQYIHILLTNPCNKGNIQTRRQLVYKTYVRGVMLPCRKCEKFGGKYKDEGNLYSGAGQGRNR